MISTSPERPQFKWQLEVDCCILDDLEKDHEDFAVMQFLATCIRCSSELHYIAFGPAGGNENIEMYFSDYDKAKEVQDAWVGLCCYDDTGKYHPEREEEMREFAEIREYDSSNEQIAVVYTDRPHIFKMTEIKPIGLKEEK